MGFERISQGATIKSKTQNHTFYTTINHDEDGKICEMFVRLDDKEQFELIQTVNIVISALFKDDVEPLKIACALKKVHSPVTNHMIPGTSTMCPSIVARIGYILEDYVNKWEKDNE